MRTIIETHDVAKIFNKGEHTEVRAVRGIDIILKEGKRVSKGEKKHKTGNNVRTSLPETD